VLRKRTFAHVLQQVAKPPVTALHRAVAIALALQQVCATKPYRTILDVWWGDPKKPYVFELANGNPIDFAGLWDALKDRVHPRTPVILHPRDYDRWLDREQTEQLPVDLLRPLDSDEMEMFEANLKVGNVRNNGPELMRAAVVAAEDGALPL
jgi:putative SOS response-associated peptidase YedK